MEKPRTCSFKRLSKLEMASVIPIHGTNTFRYEFLLVELDNLGIGPFPKAIEIRIHLIYIAESFKIVLNIN